MSNYLKKAIAPFIMLLALLFIIGVVAEFTIPDNDQSTSGIVAERTVIPGGQSVGVRMDVSGVLITGLETVRNNNGEIVSPGEDANIEIGDMIISMNNIHVQSAEDVQRFIDKEHDNIDLEIQRKSKVIHRDIKPIYSVDDKCYKLGLWIKDKTAGIGTLTYYDPVNNTFGALGHPITDSSTGAVLDIKEGQLLKSRVESIVQGYAGEPGSVQGVFFDTDTPSGELIHNCQYGIFGLATDDLTDMELGEPVVIGYQDQVHKGDAWLLTTLDSNVIKKYKIQIQEIKKQNKPETKSFVIKVTDHALLERCGGIVQGMSGSPIIQDNKLIGAVTHVFVDNPQKGYGIYIEWMLQESDKII